MYITVKTKRAKKLCCVIGILFETTVLTSYTVQPLFFPLSLRCRRVQMTPGLRNCITLIWRRVHFLKSHGCPIKLSLFSTLQIRCTHTHARTLYTQAGSAFLINCFILYINIWPQIHCSSVPKKPTEIPHTYCIWAVHVHHIKSIHCWHKPRATAFQKRPRRDWVLSGVEPFFCCVTRWTQQKINLFINTILYEAVYNKEANYHVCQDSHTITGCQTFSGINPGDLVNNYHLNMHIIHLKLNKFHV